MSLLPFPWPKQVTWPRWPSKEGGLLGRRRTRNIWTEWPPPTFVPVCLYFFLTRYRVSDLYSWCYVILLTVPVHIPHFTSPPLLIPLDLDNFVFNLRLHQTARSRPSLCTSPFGLSWEFPVECTQKWHCSGYVGSPSMMRHILNLFLCFLKNTFHSWREHWAPRRNRGTGHFPQTSHFHTNLDFTRVLCTSRLFFIFYFLIFLNLHPN